MLFTNHNDSNQYHVIQSINDGGWFMVGVQSFSYGSLVF